MPDIKRDKELLCLKMSACRLLRLTKDTKAFSPFKFGKGVKSLHIFKSYAWSKVHLASQKHAEIRL